MSKLTYGRDMWSSGFQKPAEDLNIFPILNKLQIPHQTNQSSPKVLQLESKKKQGFVVEILQVEFKLFAYVTFLSLKAEVICFCIEKTIGSYLDLKQKIKNKTCNINI